MDGGRIDPVKILKEELLRTKTCAHHPPPSRSRSAEEAALFNESFQHCSAPARLDHLRWMAKNDLFFLGVYILRRKHWIESERATQWCFDRCAEVEAEPDNCLDVWSREHFKSDVITFARVIQDILLDPNVTIGIFSHTRPMAKTFLKVIKVEFETNELLKELFPEIMWRDDPLREGCPKWALDEGITVKRDSNRRECTVEAWGLIDGQPTGKRFAIIVYDDVISRTEISALMIAKADEELENSYFLTASDPPRYRFVGTPQEIGDTICQQMEKGVFKVRKRVGLTKDGTPLFFSSEKLASLKARMTPKTFALQFLLDPEQAREAHNVGFEGSWFKHYKAAPNWRSMNRLILVDPAGKNKDSNSFTAIWVVGLAGDRNYYIIDGLVDELNLVQRGDAIFKFVRDYEIVQSPNKVVYEQYAMQADAEYLRDRQDRENCRFIIVTVSGVKHNKDQRIERLIPWFRDGRILFPESLPYRQWDGTQIDLIKRFKDVEYSRFPFNPKCRDQLDALSRLCDESEINCPFPLLYGQANQRRWDTDPDGGGGSWLSA